MRQIRITEELKLYEFVPRINNSPIFTFSPCKGLLRLAQHNAFVVALIGAGTMGVILALKNGWSTSHHGSQWMGVCTSIRPTESSQCSPSKELTIPGLRNMGNNCFLNVVLQGLASSCRFQSYLDNCVQVSDALPDGNIELMPLAVAVSALLEELSILGEKRRVASPRQVMVALEPYATDFDLARQQDAAEALARLLSALKEECLAYMEHYMPHFRSLVGDLAILDGRFSNQKESGQRISLKSWNQYIHGPLDGTLGSVLTCQSCSFQFSTQFEFFHDLAISPLLDRDGAIIDGCSIQECLKHFTAPEQIVNYRCSHCSHLSAIQSLRSRIGESELSTVLQTKIEKIRDCNNDGECSCEALTTEEGITWPAVYKNACKQLKIGRCPAILCIHLHRAAIDEAGELIKLRGHVSFPLVLDLFPYTVASQEMKWGTSASEIGMHLRQRTCRLPCMKNIKMQFEGTTLPWRYNLVNEYGCYPTSVTGNVSERNLRSISLETSFLAEEREDYDDGGQLFRETTDSNREESHSHLQLEAEQCKIRDNCLQERAFHQKGLTQDLGLKQNEITKDVSFNCRNMASSAFQSPGGKQYGMCFHSRTSHCPISAAQSITNPNLNGYVNVVDNSEYIRDLKGRRSLPYELLSVVQHHGNSGSGHYTVYRKVKVSKELEEETASCMAGNPGYSNHLLFSNQQEKTNSENNLCWSTKVKSMHKRNSDVLWFKISDSDVERVAEKSVLGSDASLLFYEKVGDTD